jgi:hypothetical protein
MEATISALKELDQLFSDIGSQVFGGSTECDGDGMAALSEPVIRNQHLITRLTQAEARLADLVGQWPEQRNRVSAEERNRIIAQVEVARSKASRLMSCCEDRASQLRAGMLRLEHALGQIRQGTRYMRSSKATQINYPKFIDSHG